MGASSGGTSVLKRMPISLRAGVNDPAEVLSKIICCAKSALLGHNLYRKVAHFEKPLRVQNTLSNQPLVRCGSRCGHEPTGKGSGIHGGPDSQCFDADGFFEMLLHPRNRVREQVRAIERRQWILDVLGLTTVALGRDNELAGQLCRDFTPVITADDMQAEINAGGTPGPGQDVALVDVEHSGIDR